jgi:Domain of unknown function (DUF4268)
MNERSVPVGRLRRVPLREVWRHEALDFTVWLQANLEVLNEHLEAPLVNAEREQAAGAFSVDLVAEDSDGRTVVIENQLERSNHDHLGKLLTYLAAYEASTAIWIVTEPRAEHVKAVAWLNDSSQADVYLLKVEAVRIGDSAPAPLLTKLVGPSAESRDIATTKQERSKRHELRRRFWTGLLARARQRTRLHATISPGAGPYLGTSAGKPGLSYYYGVGKHKTSVGLWIDRGKEAAKDNPMILDALAAQRAAIDAAFGPGLIWDRMAESRACKIICTLDSGGWADEDRWPQIQEETITAMERLDPALRSRISALDLAALPEQTTEISIGAAEPSGLDVEHVQ